MAFDLLLVTDNQFNAYAEQNQQKISNTSPSYFSEIRVGTGGRNIDALQTREPFMVSAREYQKEFVFVNLTIRNNHFDYLGSPSTYFRVQPYTIYKNSRGEERRIGWFRGDIQVEYGKEGTVYYLGTNTAIEKLRPSMEYNRIAEHLIPLGVFQLNEQNRLKDVGAKYPDRLEFELWNRGTLLEQTEVRLAIVEPAISVRVVGQPFVINDTRVFADIKQNEERTMTFNITNLGYGELYNVSIWPFPDSKGVTYGPKITKVNHLGSIDSPDNSRLVSFVLKGDEKSKAGVYGQAIIVNGSDAWGYGPYYTDVQYQILLSEQESLLKPLETTAKIELPYYALLAIGIAIIGLFIVSRRTILKAPRTKTRYAEL
ncbi:MAG: hypothetical protein HYY22_02510 [Thaumarchaeota archaeon]|nr:hypothetical protein [Nitrososphaerota archaeon]